MELLRLVFYFCVGFLYAKLWLWVCGFFLAPLTSLLAGLTIALFTYPWLYSKISKVVNYLTGEKKNEDGT